MLSIQNINHINGALKKNVWKQKYDQLLEYTLQGILLENNKPWYKTLNISNCSLRISLQARVV